MAVDAEYATSNAAALTTRYTDFLCALSARMTGSATADYKYTCLLRFALDMLLQAQARAPCEPVADALTRLVTAVVPVLSAAIVHPLAAVRGSSCVLAAVALSVLRAPGASSPGSSGVGVLVSSGVSTLELPARDADVSSLRAPGASSPGCSNKSAAGVSTLVSARDADVSSPGSLAATMEAAIAAVLSAAQRAVAESNADAGASGTAVPGTAAALTGLLGEPSLGAIDDGGAAVPMDTGMDAVDALGPGTGSKEKDEKERSEMEGVEASKRVHAWEAAIDWQSSFVMALSTSVYTPMLRDHVARALAWVLDAQGLQHPGLQVIVLQVRNR